MPTPSRDYARLSGLGIEFTLTVGLFGWLGYYVDRRWQLTGEFPLFLLLAVPFGMGLGIYRMNYQLAAWQAARDSECETDDDSALPGHSDPVDPGEPNS